MNCLPCFTSNKTNSIRINDHLPVIQAAELATLPSPADKKNCQEVEVGTIAAKSFTFRELATATKNFRQECLLDDGGFGKIYKGTLQASGQVVAVKRLDRNGMQGNKEFLFEVSMLSRLKHKNLLDLIGYCADCDQRLLVHEYLPLGSLETHLFDNPVDKEPLDWTTRMKIASGIAQGLEYLHETANPPVVYRDMKAANILLEEGYQARLSEFGLAKFAESGNHCCTPPRLMNTYGYSAPEYSKTGEVTVKSDIYSFGVILLELVTGRRAMDPDRPLDEQNLVTWAHPIFKDPKRFPEMADPLLKGEFSVKCLNQAVGIAAMCLEEEPSVRPYITDVVVALSFLEMAQKGETTTPTSKLPAPTASQKDDDQCDEEDDMSDDSSEDSSSDNEEDDHEEDNTSDTEDKTDHDEDSSSDNEEEDNKSYTDGKTDHDEDSSSDNNKKNDHKEKDNKSDTEDKTDRDETSSSSDSDEYDDNNDDDDDDEEEMEISEIHKSHIIHPVNNDEYSKGDKDDRFSQKRNRKSMKSRSKKANADSSDEESMYSSSTRTSTSSSNDEGR